MKVLHRSCCSCAADGAEKVITFAKKVSLSGKKNDISEVRGRPGIQWVVQRRCGFDYATVEVGPTRHHYRSERDRSRSVKDAPCLVHYHRCPKGWPYIQLEDRLRMHMEHMLRLEMG